VPSIRNAPPWRAWFVVGLLLLGVQPSRADTLDLADYRGKVVVVDL